MIQKRGARWRVVAQAGRDSLTGRRLQLSGSAKSEREAVRLERDLRLQADNHVTGTVTLSRVVEEWWESRPRLAPTTVLNYRNNLKNHILPVLGARKVGELRPGSSPGSCAAWSRKRASARPQSGKVRTVLSAVMSYAVAMEYVDANPVMKVPPPEASSSARVAPSVEDTARILLEAEASDPDFAVFLWVAAEEGGRRGETLALRWSDVDFAAGRLTIERTITAGEDGIQIRPTTKTGVGRTMAISAVALAQLEAHRVRVEERLTQAAGVPMRVDPMVWCSVGARAAGARWWTGCRGGRMRPPAGSGWSSSGPTFPPASISTVCGTP